MLGTKDAWFMSCLSHRPSEPAYYIEDFRISNQIDLLHNLSLVFQFTFQIRKTKANLAKFATNISKQKATEDRITMMVIVVVWLFVVSNSFQFAYYQTFRSSMASYVMFVLSYFVVTLNCSVNSVVYGIFSKKYREVFVEHFCRKKKVQAEIQMISVTSKKPDVKK